MTAGRSKSLAGPHGWAHFPRRPGFQFAGKCAGGRPSMHHTIDRTGTVRVNDNLIDRSSVDLSRLMRLDEIFAPATLEI
jgi:hypothetical protein